MADLLLELFSEEIPARMQKQAAANLRRAVTERLAAAELQFADATAYATPRRLALVVRGLPTTQPDVSEERRGPRADAPDKAIQGFLGSVGLTLDQVEKRETPKGVFLFAVTHKSGGSSRDILAEILPDALAALPWPKSMRWGAHAMRWVRPLHQILCLFDDETLAIRYGHLTAGRETRGHRFMAPDAFSVSIVDDYTEKLRAARVMVDGAERQAVIARDAAAAAEADGLVLNDDPGLLAEVAGLVEWPVVLLGRIDDSFMDVPREVLTSAMRTHQRYFTVSDKAGRLAPRFVMVSNLQAEDGGRAIVDGNERVLRARLADAKFFWDLDCNTRLEDRLADLDAVIYHAKLGDLGQKAARLADLSAAIAERIDNADPEQARLAGRLAKADLVSEMVGEFPELQGIMGRYYAENDGLAEPVAQAIGSHYAPQGPADGCPTAGVSVATALADKIDALVGFFGIGEPPTGSRDPFALRRAALGVIRLILENKIRLPLLDIFDTARGLYTDQSGIEPMTANNDVLLDFIAERLKVHLRENGRRHDHIAAVFDGDDDDLVRRLARVDALVDFLAGDDGANLLVAYRRAANILRIEEKKDGRRYDDLAAEDRLDLVEERNLYHSLDTIRARARTAVQQDDFSTAMAALASLRAPVDAFFDAVTVNADDQDRRVNRLCLLSQIRGALHEVADFSKIEG